MKKIVLIIVFAFIGLNIYSQTNDTVKMRENKNEISVDMTKFVLRFMPLAGIAEDVELEPIYALKYKRDFKHFSLRLGVGVDFYQINEEESYVLYENGNYGYSTRDTILENASNQFEYRFKFGAEKSCRISSRWEFIYGLDVIYNRMSSLSEGFNSYTNAAYSTKTKSSGYFIGGAPFAGVKYNINKRLSLYTESFYLVGMEKTIRSNTYSNVLGQSAPKSTSLTLSGTRSYFITPISIHFAIKL